MRLRNVYLHVTKACNLSCKYCYFSARKPLSDELTADELIGLWPDLVDLAPSKIVFTGGEPLLRNDIFNLLEGLKAADSNHRIRRCLNTNGHLVTDGLASMLIGLVDEVRVSLDGLAKRNDKLRGKGNFDAALQALKTLYSVGFEPKVLITITTMTLPDLEGLMSLLVENRFTRISLNNFRPIGRGLGHWDWRADPEDVRSSLNRAWRRCYPDETPPPEPAYEDEQCSCGVGNFLNILPNGDVFPCHVLTQPEFRCGRVRESAGINRLGIENERVLQRKPSQLLWPRTVRWRW